jgi:hypothetical protein
MCVWRYRPLSPLRRSCELVVTRVCTAVCAVVPRGGQLKQVYQFYSALGSSADDDLFTMSLQQVCGSCHLAVARRCCVVSHDLVRAQWC